jgi:hypothetical protein
MSMDDLDARLRAAFWSLTEAMDLEGSRHAVGIAVRAARRSSRPVVSVRFAAAMVAALLVAVSVGGAAVLFSRAGPAVVPSGRPAVASKAPAVAATAADPTPASEGPIAGVSRLDWNRYPLQGDAAGQGTMLAVTAGGPGLVAVGRFTDVSHHHNTPTSERHHTEAVVWRAFGDAAWLRVTGQPGFTHAAMQDVASSRGVVVAAGYDDAQGGAGATRLWRSLDGADWTVLPDTTIPAGTRLSRVLGTPAGFLASGVEVTPGEGPGRGVVWRSDDGVAWTRAADPASFESGVVNAIFEIGEELVAIGQKRGDYLRINPPLLWRSSDASRWEAVPLSNDAFGSDLAGIAAIAAGGPGYIAVGTVIDTLSPQDPTTQIAWPPTDGAIWTSPDLRTWTRVEPARELFGGEENQAITSLVAVRNGYIAFGSTGRAAGAWSSADGERWERVELPEAASGMVDDALVMNGAIIAVGGVGDSPAVWRGSAGGAPNSPGAIAGVGYPISIYTHCGLDRSRIDFDSSFWNPVGETSDGQGNPPDGYDNPYDSGTIRLLPDGTSEFTSSQGVRLRLERFSAARSLEPCA